MYKQEKMIDIKVLYFYKIDRTTLKQFFTTGNLYLRVKNISKKTAKIEIHTKNTLVNLKKEINKHYHLMQ